MVIINSLKIVATSGCIACRGVIEVAPNAMRRFLDKSQIPDDRIPHVLGRGDDLAPNAMILQVIPDSLIGIEFGGVGREEEQTNPLLDGFALQERLHPLDLMDAPKMWTPGSFEKFGLHIGPLTGDRLLVHT